MANGLEPVKDVQKDSKGKVEPRLVFVSHSHADRELAGALGTLIDTVFSGVVRPFVSSDPGPTGGIMPGDQWYSQIEESLRRAEAVWVLATPTSIKRPWIYWEAGTGRALCGGGVVVLRVGLAVAEIPSPLSSFQSYDGLQTGEVAQLVGKVAHQVGLTLAPVLTDTCAKTWVEVADGHKPLVRDDTDDAPALAPERLDRLDAAIARLEAVAVPSTVTAAERERRLETVRERARLEREVQEASEDRRRRVLGLAAVAPDVIVYEDVDDFLGAVDNAPDETTFHATEIDEDGDAQVIARRGPEATTIYLDSTQLRKVKDTPAFSGRTRRLITEIAALRDRQRTRRRSPPAESAH